MSELMPLLLANFALVSIFVMVWDAISDWSDNLRPLYRSTLMGIIFGIVITLSMNMPMEITTDFRFDLHAVLVTLSALFGGLPAATITTGIAVVIRLEIGGGGVAPDILSAVLAMIVGLAVHYTAKTSVMRMRELFLGVIGLIFVNLASYPVIPMSIDHENVAQTTMSLAAALTVSTLVIGVLLIRADNRTRLMRDNQVFRQIVQQLPYALSVRDIEGRCLVANPAAAQLSGLAHPGKMLDSKEIYQASEDQGSPSWKETIDQIEAGTPIAFEHSVMRENGAIDRFATLKAPLQNKRKQIVGVISCSHNITDAWEAREAKNEFISTVSHELRTPLTSIKGSLGLITSGKFGTFPEKATRLIKIAQSNCERLVALINDILDIEKISNGIITMNFEQRSLRPLLEEVISSNMSYMSEKNISIVFADDIFDPTVNVDAGRIIQVLNNLLSNAIKFAPNDGMVTVGARPLGDDIEVFVIDNGPGVPEQFHDRIFGRFEQSDSSDTRSKGGTGLGLHISKEIMNRLGGEIGFDRHRDVGARFYVRLPSVRNQAENAEREEADNRVHVLVCSENPQFVTLIGRELCDEGFAFDLASDPQAAKTLTEQSVYLALIMDAESVDNTTGALTDIALPMKVISLVDVSAVSLASHTSGVVGWLRETTDSGPVVEILRDANDC